MRYNICIKLTVNKNFSKIIKFSATLFFVGYIFLGNASQAQAAISFVSSTCEASDDGVGTYTLTLPTTQEGDLVVVAVGTADNDNVNEDVGPNLVGVYGYTEVADVFADDTTADTNFGVFWKFMGATPDTSYSLDSIGGNDASNTAVCMVFRGVDTATPMDVAPTSISGLSTMHPNPPSIDHNNPSGVWTVIAGASGHSLNNTTNSYTFPTGYTTNTIKRAHIDTTDATVGMGYRSSGVSDPEDPGVMTLSGTDNAGYGWGAATIALRPAPPVTTLGDGTDPGNSTIAPGASATAIDNFSLVTSSGTDTVTGMTVTLAGDASAYTNIATVAIKSTDDVTTYCSSTPSSNTVLLTTCGISATTTPTSYVVKITPYSHAAMPAPATGASYATTATVTSITPTSNSVAGTDTDSATITVDNASPTSATVPLASTASNTRVNLKWTTTSGETTNAVVLRWAAGVAGAEVPVEGTTYTAGDTITTATVACVFSSQTTATALSKLDGNGGDAGCTTSALTNGQAYSYKVFSQDSNGNYDTGIAINGSPLTPSLPNITVSASTTTCPGTPSYTSYSYGTCVVNTADVVTTLNGASNVSITTEGSITVSSAIAKSAGGSATLSLYAGENISINSAISSSTGALGLLLNADRDANLSGYVSIGAALTSLGGNMTMGGGSGAISAGSGFAYGNSGQASGIYVNGVAISAGGGSIIMNGNGYTTNASNYNYGVYMTGASADVTTTGSGTINVTGIGGGNSTSAHNYGVFVAVGASFSTVDGNITVTGTGGGSGSGTDNYGIYIKDANSTISITGIGGLTVTGTGGTAGSGISNMGIYCGIANCIQATTSGGTINVTGNATGSSGNAHGMFISNGTITGAGGAMVVNGTGAASSANGNFGIYVTGTGAITNTGTGTLTVNGTGGGITNSGTNYGIASAGSGTISTVDGNLTVTGTGGGAGTGTNNWGVYMTVSGIVKTTGSGNLSITGIRGGGASASNFGFKFVNYAFQTTGTGDMTLITDTIECGTVGAVSAVRDLVLRPYTASTTIRAGAGASGTLYVDMTCFDWDTGITGGVFTIGGISAGNISIVPNNGSSVLNKNVTYLTGGNITLGTTALDHSGATPTTLNMLAYGNITTTSAITASTSALTINLHSDYDANASGAISIGAGVSSNGGTISILGGGGTLNTTSAYDNLTINVNSGNTLTLGSALNVTGGLTLTSGTLDTSNGNNYAISADNIAIANSANAIITPRASIVSLTGTGTVWNMGASGVINAGTSTIKLTNNSVTGKTFAGAGKTYNNFWFAPSTGTGSLTITGSNTFADFQDDGTGAHTIIFAVDSTTTITSLTLDTNATSNITLESANSGVGDWNIVDTAGTNTVSYITIKDSNASGGAIWNAYNGTNTDGNNNTGWSFSLPSCDSQVDTTGYWNTIGSWTCGRVPTTGDIVIISAGDTITMNVDSAVLGTITINGTLNTSDGTSRALSGTTISIGTSGVLTANASTITLSGTSGTLFTVASGGSFSEGTSTLVLSGNGDATINSASETFNILTSSGTGTKSLGAATIVNGLLTISAGTFQIGVHNFTTAGGISVTGTIDDNSNIGINSLNGGVTINNGGTWTSTGNEDYEINGGLTVNFISTFTSGSGTYLFSFAQTIGGTQAFTIENATNSSAVANGLTIEDADSTITNLTQNSGAILTFAGAVPSITVPDFDISTNTVQYTSASAQTIKGTTYHHLTKSGAGTATLGGATVLNGNLTISAGTLELAGNNFTTTGTSSITGTLSDASVTGTNLFIGAVTINSGGIWTTTNDPAFEFRGGLACNSVAGFTSGSGVYNFSTSVQTISSSGGGTCAITNLTNNIDSGDGLTISSAQPTVTTLTQSVNTILTFSGTVPSITNLTANAGGNIVQYTSGSAQTVKGTTYVNLIKSGAGTATLGGATIVGGNLTISAGTVALSTYDFTVTGTSSITGTLNDASATGTNLFTGAVTINSGGIWTNSGNSAMIFRGGLTNNSSAGFTSGSGVYTFNTNAQTVTGTQVFTIANLTNSITNGTGLTVANANVTIGTLTQDTNAILTFSGIVPAITTLTATASPNTVQYTGASQTVVASLSTQTHSLDLESTSTQYASITDVSQTGLDITGDMTLEAWIRAESLPSASNRMVLASKFDTTGDQRAYRLAIYNNGGVYQLEFTNSSDGTDANTYVQAYDHNYGFTTATWYHVAMTYDSTKGIADFYVDGTYLGSVSNDNWGNIFNSSAAFSIGTDSVTASPFDGLIKDVRVFNDIRTASEIANDKDRQYISDSNLQVEWNLNNDYLDNTANNNDLTATNSPAFSAMIPTYTNVQVYHDLTINVSGTATSDGRLDVNDDFTISGGTFSTGNYEMKIGGNYSNSGIFNAGTGTVIFDAGDIGNTIFGTLTGSSKFNNINFNNSAGAWTFGANDTEVGGDFTVTLGAVTAPSTTLTISGDFTNTPETAQSFVHNSGTVVFNTTGTSSIIGDTTFNALTVATGGKKVLFGAGDTFRTNSTLTLTGSSYNSKVEVDSTNGRSRWFINQQGVGEGNPVISFVHLNNSGCHASSLDITMPANSVDGSNNDADCWIFTQVSRGGGGGNAGGESSDGSGAGTCIDGIQNGNETGVDQGGRCAGGGGSGGGGGGSGGEGGDGSGAGTCSDGQQNGNETGVDSGGRCAGGGGSGGGGGDSGFLFDNIRFIALVFNAFTNLIF